MISKKVSKMNGDLRVAFDILKSCFIYFHSLVLEEMPEDKLIKATLNMVIKVFRDKYATKIPETLSKLPRQAILVCEVIVNLFAV